ncbi:MAG: site-specific DNA-methyltransferase [bacterium]
MPHERLKPTLTLDLERIEELKRILPEGFADGKINWETMKQALGEHLEDEGADAEHFGLFWPGKREARRMAAIPSKGTLAPVPGEGIDEETTRNIFIEGENLEVLKLLQKSYAGKIKMIYIDPPYNTGNDFVYEDDFREPLEEYLRRTDQVDEEGKPWTTNTRAEGRYHSKWLSMMFTRLKLARNLLKGDGVIVVSIDNNELHNLREMMNEVFGEENFVGLIVVQSNPRGRQSERFLATVHEYLILYAKDIDWCKIAGAALSEKQLSDFKYDDGDRKKYRLLGLRQRGSASRRQDRPKMYYPIYVDPKTATVSLEKTSNHKIEVLPKKSSGEEGRWMWSKEKVQKNLSIVVSRLISGRDEWDIFIKDFLHTEEGEQRTRKFKTIWDEKELNYQNGTQEVKELLGPNVMEFPKPTSLLRKIISLADAPDEIYLDFFAGSGTTGHALFQTNLADEGNRKFILIQLDEPCKQDSAAYKAGYKTIADICKQRIKKAAKELKKNNTNSDLGIKVFKLAKSNYKIWQDYDGANLPELESKLDLFETPLAEDWKPENLLTEILLLEGFPLDSKIEKLNDHKKNAVNHVSSDFCEHKLLVCLDAKIGQETINALKFEEDDIFVCLDSALTDQDKMRLADVCKLKTI